MVKILGRVVLEMVMSWEGKEGDLKARGWRLESAVPA